MGVIKYILKGLPYAVVFVTAIVVLTLVIIKVLGFNALVLVLLVFLTLLLALLIGFWKN